MKKLEEKEIVEIYNREENFTYSYDIEGIANKMRIKQIENIVLNSKISSFLDVGCGNGYFVKLLQEKGVFSLGIDISENLLKKFYSKGNLRIVANGVSIPFKSNTFDFILASQLIEHIPDYKRFLLECYRLLKGNGYLLITVPNIFCYDSFDSLLGFQKYFKKLFKISPHLHLNKFFPTKWRQILVESHFKICMEKPIYIFPYIPYFLKGIKSLEFKILANGFVNKLFIFIENKISQYYPFKYLGQFHFFLCKK